MRPANADLFYKVEKRVSLGSVASAPNQARPMVVTGLTNPGMMVGFFTDSGARPHVEAVVHAFAWDNTAVAYHDVNNEIGAHGSMAVCVNATGTVAGVRWETTGSRNGFVWKAGIGGTTFLSPEGGDIDLVTGINSVGHVIGTYYSVHDLNKRAFLWDGSTCVDHGDFGDVAEPYIWPQAINDLDQVAGTSYDTSAVGQPAPTTFLWTDGVIGLLDGAEDFANTQAMGLNNPGASSAGIRIRGSHLASPSPADSIGWTA